MMSGKVRVEKVMIADEETLKRLMDFRRELLDIAEKEAKRLSVDTGDPSIVDGVICSMLLNVAVSIQIGSKFGQLMSMEQKIGEVNLLVLRLCEVIAKRLKELECKDE